MRLNKTIKIFSFFLFSLFFLSVLTAHSQFIPPQKPRPKPTSAVDHIKLDDTKYSSPGIIIRDSLIKPGDNLGVIWSVLGPPDKLWAMRGKDDITRDYVKLDYYSYGISFDLNSNTNRIQGILIEENSGLYKLKEVPFKLGGSFKDVLQMWGDPEDKTPGYMMYWRRGVYIGVDDAGNINHIFLTDPGEFEDERGKER